MRTFSLVPLFCKKPQTAVDHFDKHKSCKYCEHAPGCMSDRGHGARGTISEFVENLKRGNIVNCEEDGVKVQKGQGQFTDEIQS